MKMHPLARIIASFVLTSLPLAAQSQGDSMVEPVLPSDSGATTTVIGAPTPTDKIPSSMPPPSGDLAIARDMPPPGMSEPGAIPTPPAPADTTPPANTPATDNAQGTSKFPPLEQQKKDIEKSEEGYLIKDAALNDIFQFLAKKAGRQYFHNFKINTPDFHVTGHLNDGNPLQQMEELAFMYGLTLYTKGNTVYALTQAQLNQLPSAEFQYQLSYLRPTDMEQIKELIKPLLTPGTGIVNFEPKTNTIIIIDSASKIEHARELLHNIDRAKGQIVVETKILRISDTNARRTGMDWSSSLGKAGVPIEVSKSLNSVFGLHTTIAATAISKGQSLNTSETAANSVVLSPIQINGVLRALAECGLARQVSNPTLITEDNEQANIAIIDRVPIITTTVSQSQGNNNISEEVRYKIDKEDASISSAPDKHREIGISLSVSPTLLPDGTIRMRLRPRSAQIVEQIKGQSGNLYPRVTESMIESLTRVPDGHSLVVGGFYGEIADKNGNQVPLLGRLPVLGFFFKSKETVSEKSSLVFVVTPTSYNPASRSSNDHRSRALAGKLSIFSQTDWNNGIEPEIPREPASMPGAKSSNVPYYPDHTGSNPNNGYSTARHR